MLFDCEQFPYDNELSQFANVRLYREVLSRSQAHRAAARFRRPGQLAATLDSITGTPALTRCSLRKGPPVPRASRYVKQQREKRVAKQIMFLS